MIKNNFRTVPATNFAKKEEQRRQINKQKKQELAKAQNKPRTLLENTIVAHEGKPL
jgi:hypothetical protein